MSDNQVSILSEEKLISIVVPVYRVEEYLNRCIESIISQTYQNLEIILVDDGSPDTCGNICDRWGKKDLRIKVIHKSNGGVSEARNVGINEASGEYIAFVDSDDYVNNKYIEKMYHMCVQYNVDVAICDFHRLAPRDADCIIQEGIKVRDKIYDGVSILKEMYTSANYQKVIVAWNKLYKMELFKEVRFPKGKINEDGFTTHKILYNAKRIAVTNEKLYVYILTPNSITRRRYDIKSLDDLESFEVRNEFFYENKEYELYRLSLSWYMYTLRTHYYMCRYFYPELTDIYDLIWKFYCITFNKTLLYKEMPVKRKLSMGITYLFREFYLKKFIKDNGLEEEEIEDLSQYLVTKIY